MLWIHVVRIRCEVLAQGDLLRIEREPTAIITEALLARPTANVGRGSEWHIGHSEILPNDGVIFQMGRTVSGPAPQFDVERHSFFEAEVERAPYTIGVFDQRHQTAGIIKKSGVSQSASEISAKLERLLNAVGNAEAANVRIVVDPINDPADFIEQLRDASAITKFSFTAAFPNPHDVERLIQRPAEEFTKAAGGERTKVEVEGESLNRELLEDLAKGVASTGDQAAASVRKDGSSRTKRIYLGRNPVLEPLEEGPSKSLYQTILTAVREGYDRVRNSAR
jgi:hypothetical protein